jgi:hypothetical protein
MRGCEAKGGVDKCGSDWREARLSKPAVAFGIRRLLWTIVDGGNNVVGLALAWAKFVLYGLFRAPDGVPWVGSETRTHVRLHPGQVRVDPQVEKWPEPTPVGCKTRRGPDPQVKIAIPR